GKVGKAAGLAATAFIGLQVAGAVVESFAEARITAEEFTASLLNSASASDVTAESINGMIAATGTGNASVTDLANALDILDAGAFGKTMDQLNAGFGVWDTQGEIAAEQVGKLDQALTTLAQTGSAEQMQESWTAALDASGKSAEELLSYLPGLRTELTNVATGMGLAADDATLLKILMGEITPVVDEATGAVSGYTEGVGGAEDAMASAADAADEMLSSIQELANEFISSERAALDYADSMEEAGKAASENGKHWEDGTEAADENKRALLDLAEQALSTADALAPKGESGTFLKEARDDLIEVALQMGLSREEAELYVDQLLATPEQIQTQIDLDTQAAAEEWAAFWDEQGMHPPQVPVDADTTPAENSKQLFEDSIVSSDPALAPVGADTSGAEGTVNEFGQSVGGTETAPVPVKADIQPAQMDVINLENTIAASGGTVTINGNATPGDQVLDTLMAIINSSDGTVTIDGETYPADRALSAAITAINNGSGTVEIDGNNSGAKSATNDAVSHANGSSGSIDVDARTAGANAAINNAARTRTAYINVVSRGANNAARVGMRAAGFATGGAVWGAGTGTSDSIPALLSNGEH
ncbi:TPA: hypothetical protein OQU49_004278, partial [Shigella flexneri]|nr:hypothetical protein [Shigella flexneri]